MPYGRLISDQVVSDMREFYLPNKRDVIKVKDNIQQ